MHEAKTEDSNTSWYEWPTDKRRAAAYFWKRCPMHGLINEKWLSVVVYALSVERRGQLLTALQKKVTFSSAVREELPQMVSRPADLARFLWNDVYESEPDEDDDVKLNVSSRAFRRYFNKTIAGVLKQLDSTEASLSDYDDRVAQVRRSYDFDEATAGFLLFVFLMEKLPNAANAFGDINLNGYLRLASAVLDVPFSRLRSFIDQNSMLFKYELATLSLWNEPPIVTTKQIENFFEGHVSSLDPAQGLSESQGRTFRLNSFPVEKKECQLLLGLLQSERPSNILIYGAPGAGKTELVRSLAVASGRRAYFVTFPNGELGSSSLGSRMATILAAQELVKTQGALLVVDEADRVLNTEELFSFGDKGPVVSMLDSASVPTIWISNSVESLHPAVVRRLAYSLHFERPGNELRLSRLESELRKWNLKVPAKARRRIARTYDVSLGSIGRTVAAVAALVQTPDVELTAAAALELFLQKEHLLLHEQEARDADGPNREVNTLTGAPYRPEVLNTSISLEELASSLQCYIDARKAKPESVGPMNILFYGIPGTGKTALGYHLGKTLGQSVTVVSGSDLLDSLVGQTEHNIAEMFRKLTKEDTIVILDEAENLLQRRVGASQSFERQFVNEFLTRMERHRGIFVCTTNALSIMDPAALRRFAYKVEFFALRAEDRLAIYRAYFTLSHRRLTPVLQQRILRLEGLTAGTVRTVFNRFRYGGLATASHEDLIAALEEEIEIQRPGAGTGQRTIGFGA